METAGLQSLAEIDSVIAAAEVPGADRGKLISGIKYSPDLSALADADPFSEVYRACVTRIYEHMRGQAYDVGEEANTNAYMVTEPSPYSSRHPHLIGNHLGAIVTVVRDIGKLPPARVLDMGFGAGDTSLMLARCGFTVDAVDVNPRFVEILRHWIERVHVQDRVNVLQMEYDALERLDGPYDAVLFFESFHHALNHADLISVLNAKLKPGGVIIFAGEPIYDHFPLPWGLRHNEGLATYCIRKFGWMELGFQTSYFLELLERNGLCAVRRTYTDYPVANHFRAIKPTNSLPVLDLCIRAPYAVGWHPANGDVRWTKGSAAIPLSLLGSASAFSVEVQNSAPMPMRVALRANDVVLSEAVVGPAGRAVLTAECRDRVGALWIDAPSWVPREVGLSNDPRTLGIAVRAIHLAAARR